MGQEVVAVKKEAVTYDSKIREAIESPLKLDSLKGLAESIKGMSFPKYGIESSPSPAGHVSQAEAAKFKEFHDAHKGQFNMLHNLSKLGSEENQENMSRAIEKELRPDMAKFLDLPADRANSLRILSVDSTFKKSDGSEIPAIHMEITAGLSHIYSTMAISRDGELLFSTAKDFKRYNEGIDTLKQVGKEHVGAVRSSLTADSREKEMECLEPLRTAIEKDFSDLLRKDEKLLVTVGMQEKEDVGKSAVVHVSAVSKTIGIGGEKENFIPLGEFLLDLKNGDVGFAHMEGATHERVLPREAYDSQF